MAMAKWDEFQWTMAKWDEFQNYCEAINWHQMICACTNTNELWDCCSSLLNEGIVNLIPENIRKTVAKFNIPKPFIA